MKILLVSMPSLHFFRWSEQLEQAGHEVYWFDIVDGNPTERLPFVTKINGWKLKYPNLKGRYFIKNKLPFLYKILRPLIERNVATEFEKILLEIQPDLVHSFVLYVSCTPILKVMQKHEAISWAYSSWGSDLYYFKNIPKYNRDIQKVLPRINYLFTDCKRDVGLAKELGFNGEVLGTFPGGGGFKYAVADKFIITPASERHTILVKGYQGRSGKSITVLKALLQLEKELRNYKVIVFGADNEVISFAKKHKLDSNLNFSIYSRYKFLPHLDILKLMGEALIYIGNSNSDGMPNTLLEAIAMGAFPIQSNPGNVSAEVIAHKENGFLISDFENIDEIKGYVQQALSNSKLIEKAFIINQMEIKPQFEREKIKTEVLQAYHKVNFNISEV